MRTVRILTVALTSALVSLNNLGWASTVSVPPLPKKTYTKATVKWPAPSVTPAYAFAVPCGQTANVCATVTPARLAAKFSWVDPAGVLSISAGTDPSCNGGQGGFLTVGGPTTGCTPGQQAIAAKLNGKVVSTGQGVLLGIETETVATIPSDTTRKKLGVGEEVTLTLKPTGLSPITWGPPAGGGTLDNTSGESVVFTASDRAASGSVTETVTATYAGVPIAVDFTVVEPASESAVKIPCPPQAGEPTYPAGTLGASMCLEITVAPTDVSFENLQYREVGGPASNVSGYIADFLQKNPQVNLTHTPAGWLTISEGNKEYDLAAFVPGVFTPPWYAGGWQWDIPVEWRVGQNGSVGTLPHRLQTFSVMNTAGTSTVSKLGQSATRTP